MNKGKDTKPNNKISLSNIDWNNLGVPLDIL